MIHNSPISTIRHRITSYVMLLLFAYQIGACPCGCVEHNSWLELLGFDHHQVTDSAAGLSATDDHHDCTGASRPEYVGTARQNLPQAHGEQTGLSKLILAELAFQPAGGSTFARLHQASQCESRASGLRTLSVMRV